MIAADKTVDDVDRLVAAALQANGRASWGQIARTLELPERTVARRGQRLFVRGLVRVSTYVDVARVLHARPMLLRIRTEPGALWPVARALAERPDASSVSILEGSNDIATMVLPRDQSSIRRMLFEDLPRLERVSSLQVTTVLRFFRAGYEWQPGVLEPSQVAQLNPGHVDPSADDVGAIGEDDEKLIDQLVRDGRAPVAALARGLNASQATIRRRLESLFERGLLHVRTEVAPVVFGLQVEALVWFRVPMDRLDQVGADLASAPEVKFCAATTGTSQLLADVLVPDEDAFYRFLTGDRVAGHQGLEVVESLMVITPVLRGSLVIDEGPAL